MPELLAASYVAAKDALHSIAPWIWLFTVDTDGSNALRYCGHESAVIVGGYTFSPMHVAIGGITRDAEGNLPEPEITVSNVTRQVTGVLELGGIVDRNVAIQLVLSTDLANPVDWGTYRVLDATATLTTATFRVGVAGLFEAQFPDRRFSRGRCDYVYGGTECLYDTSLPNLIAATRPSFDPSSCGLDLEGGNGCRAHGENEAANGHVVNHPRRFGGHPSIPRGPARV